MLSIIVIARNVPDSAVRCTHSIFASVFKLHLTPHVEYLLVDDASDSGKEVAPAFAALRPGTTSAVRVIQFRKRQHYSRAMAHAFSMARGESILFVSHDMIISAAYLKTLLAVASLDSSIGIVRGTSPYVDCFPNHVIKPALPMRTIEDVFEFSEYVSRLNGLDYEEDQFLTGDSMLVLPAALQKVGVFDPRYYGYFGDIDFGLRVRRAGLKMVCAKGAWLLHEGAAYYSNEAAGKDYAPIQEARMKVVREAYLEFRRKWAGALAPEYEGTHQIDFAMLRSVQSPAGGEYQSPVVPHDSDYISF